MPDSVDSFEINTPDGVARLPVKLVFSPHARGLRLTVGSTGNVRLSFPRGTHRENAARFIREKSAWILRALAAAKPASTIAAHLEKFPWVTVAGKICILEISETQARPFFVFREGEELVIFRHRGGEHRENDLQNLLRALATKTLPARTAHWGRETGAAFKRVSIRNQRGRWGSCSGNGTISLNWRLLLLPPALQDYVILHELAHTREMNHSSKFWDQLARWDRESEKNDRALTKEWGNLMHLGQN